MTDLVINKVVVASSRVDDGQEPSNVALFYEAIVDGTEEVKVLVKGDNRTFFVEKQQL